MSLVKINIPEGFKLKVSEENAEFTMEFVPEKKVESKTKSLPTTEDEILKKSGWTKKRFRQVTLFMHEHEKAYLLLTILSKLLNGDWTPDWNNPNEYKYSPYFEMDGSSGFRFGDSVHWRTLSNVGSRLCYKTKELSDYAGEQFVRLYERFMVIPKDT